MQAENLHMILSPWLFARWGLDIMGPLPRASTKEKFLLMMTDYFTKWVEAIPLQKIGAREMVNFLYNHNIYKFGFQRF